MTKNTKICLMIASAGFGLGLILFGLFPWDIEFARLFYAQGRFPMGNHPLWRFLDRWGEIPAQLAGLLGLGAFILSYRQKRFKAWRGPGLYFFLVASLGAVLLVNIFFKGLTGRPRPYETNLFGGMWDFLRPFELGTPGKGRSFISGHAASGFFFLSLFFFWQGAKRWLGLAIGLSLGLLIGAERIVEGAHWLSDILLCGFLMFAISALLSPLIGENIGKKHFKKLALVLLLASPFILFRPIYENRVYHFDCEQCQLPTRPVDRRIIWQGQDPAFFNMDFDIAKGDVDIQWGESPFPNFSVTEEVSGFQLGKAAVSIRAAAAHTGADDHARAFLSFKQKIQGFIYGFKARYVIKIPYDFAGIARLKAPQSNLRIMLPKKGRPFLLDGDPSLALPLEYTRSSTGVSLRPGLGKTFGLNYEAKHVQFIP